MAKSAAFVHSLCRPIKLIFSKETTDFTTSETNKVLEKASQLLPTLCDNRGSQISVKHNLLLTMADGKVCNALTGTLSSQKCYICGATPKLMNGELKDVVVKKKHYSLGLSTLHAWIRSFECMLHICYCLDIKKWQAKSDIEKASVKQRSEEVRQKFKNQMGLIIDTPKPGYGNSNDGNTARRFFMNPDLSGGITGLDINLIKNFSILLRTLSSGYDINCNKFENLCSKTRTLYLNLYSWYYMPVTVHKILVHSTEVIRTCILPIGQLSEESQEARNKDCRRFPRKQSRIATNIDLLHMLLIISDPVINSLRKVPKKRTDKLPVEVLNLIVQPSILSKVPRQVTCDHDGKDYVVSDSDESNSDD
ncbi:uncharacterized protein LOC126764095 [Bactrocera neohumeralis]|uniref:uncharacterized protein LOC126764095 n=1 Tax=Bactrocera neohumeralis TaxID=98809 RepID=UPI001A97C76B|nr:uncharacterized protein LOC120780600 isoform X1 [Bactrocera tryoni]XP_050337842.1 uncharacterized protein LOC126764095 [Bactrocera neohumeralis]